MHHNTRLGSPRRRAALAVTAAAVAVGMAAGVAALTGAAAARPTGTAGSGLDPRITAIMDKPAYRHAQWGLLEVDSAGKVIHSMFPGQFFIPGSVAKLFSVSAALNVLGPGHRFTTPVYAVGQRQGTTLAGNLVLVGQGDPSLGGRTTPSGGIAYTNADHGDANAEPGTTLTPEDPLAGLDALAQQVRAAGIRQVTGNVIVDDRLFGMSEMKPNPTPLMINDNLIDLMTSPGAGPGAPARLSWRPQVAPTRSPPRSVPSRPEGPLTSPSAPPRTAPASACPARSPPMRSRSCGSPTSPTRPRSGGRPSSRPWPGPE
jgi:serine-type D-Ala-D-Ala carboxypeptidase/endopeptidase (penicillin-binding protein 4)